MNRVAEILDRLNPNPPCGGDLLPRECGMECPDYRGCKYHARTAHLIHALKEPAAVSAHDALVEAAVGFDCLPKEVMTDRDDGIEYVRIPYTAFAMWHMKHRAALAAVKGETP